MSIMGPLGPPEGAAVCGARRADTLVIESSIMGLRESGVPAPPLGGPAGEVSGANGGAHRAREPGQEPDVVQRQQSQTEKLFGPEQVPQVPARVRGAGLAIALGVERRRIFPQARV